MKLRFVMATVAVLLLAFSGLVHAEDNLLRNADFGELSAAEWPVGWTSWIPSGTVSYEVIQEGGEHIVKVSSKTSDGRASLRQMDIPVSPDRIYRVEVDFRSNLTSDDQSMPKHVVVRLQWFKGSASSENLLDVDYSDIVKVGSTSEVSVAAGDAHLFGDDKQPEWTRLSIDIKAPPEARFALVDMLLWTSLGKVYWRAPTFVDVTEEHGTVENGASSERIDVYLAGLLPPPITTIRSLRDHISALLDTGPYLQSAGRPFLYATAEKIVQIRRRVLEDDLYAVWSLNLINGANQYVGQSIAEPDWLAWVNRDATEVQLVTREVKKRLELLGFAFLLTEDDSYAETARYMMLEVASWPRWTHSRASWERWNPREMLTNYRAMLPTGEMTKTMGTAYDWFHNYLSPEDRELVREALVEKGIRPIVEEWADPETRIHDVPWNNWYAVILGGGGVGALAVLGDEPEAVAWIEMLKIALKDWFEFPGGRTEYWFGNRVGNTAPNFDPDGMYGEGFTYLDYGMSYALYFMMGLADALGDQSLLQIPQIANLPRMLLYGTYFGTDGARVVNFNDSGLAPPSSEVVAGLASLLQSPQLQWYFMQTRFENPNPHSLLWYDPSLRPLSPGDSDGFSLNAMRFRTFGWVLARTGWGSRDTFFAMKSGRSVSHGHLDAAGFIYNAGGSAFLVDSNLRSDYTDSLYREYDVQTRAHNTILVDGAGQKGTGELGAFVAVPDFTYAKAVAGSAYPQLEVFNRHALFFGSEGYLAVIDDIRASEPVQIDWLVHTPDFKLPMTADNRFSIQGGRFDLDGVVLAPEQFEFRGMEVLPDRPEAFLSVADPVAKRDRTFFVLFTPYRRVAGAPPVDVQTARVSPVGVTGADDAMMASFLGTSGTTYAIAVNETGSSRRWEVPVGEEQTTIVSDALISYVAFTSNGTVENAFITDGSELSVGGITLVRTDHSCETVIHYGNDYSDVSLYCETEGTVHISLPATPLSVEVRKATGEPKDATWHVASDASIQLSVHVDGEAFIRVDIEP